MVSIVNWMGENTLLLVLVAGAAFAFLWLLALKKRLHIGAISALVLAVLHVVVGMISVSVFALIENPQTYRLGVVSIFGGVFFMPIAYWVGAKLTKRDTKVVFDIFVVCLLFTLMCSRFNCLYSGCCHGRLLPGSTDLRWPTRESEIVFYLVLMVMFIPKVVKGKSSGQLYPVYLIAYGIFRFVNETLRYSESGKLFHISHLWAVISLLIGLSVYQEQRKKKMKVRR